MDKESIFDEAVEEEEIESSRSLTSKKVDVEITEDPFKDKDSSEIDNEDITLWKKYKASGDSKMRDALILKYAPFVKYVAGRMAVNLPNNVEYEDLVSYGVFGLMDAIEKYDPERAVQFKTYAKTRIRGAILDELRVLDWTPRSVRQKAKNSKSVCPTGISTWT